jgi:excinuclease ABC subunit C
MLAQAESLEWVKVRTDAEAFLLEYSLIKQHKPRYNIRLRDDKSYPMIAVTLNETWPRAMIYRGKKRPKNRYFGPYASAKSARITLDLLLRSLPLRSCSNSKFNLHERAGRPCLYYHIKRCSGPCIGAIQKEDYMALVEELAEVLSGKGESLAKRLMGSMRDASAQLEYERAALERDRLKALEQVLELQEVVGTDERNFDVIASFGDSLEVMAEILRVRNGRLVGVDGFILDRLEDASDEAMRSRIVQIYYDSRRIDWPSEIVVEAEMDDMESAEESLAALAGKRVKIKLAKRGRAKEMIDLAKRNAREGFNRYRLQRAGDHSARAQALEELRTALGLNRAPLRIECYDMSHLQGSNYVGSMVVMEDGLMKRSDYRHFMVSTPKNDDFAAMAEVIDRRLTRLENENETLPAGNQDSVKHVRKFSYRPDLIVLDGGKGQLSAVLEIMEKRGTLNEISVCALAKEFEEVYLPGLSEPVRIARGSPALYLLQQLRDEAHRFAISYHRKRRVLTRELSVIDSIKGLGPKRRDRLLNRFGSVYEMALASEEELASIVPIEVAKRLREQLQLVYGHRLSE